MAAIRRASKSARVSRSIPTIKPKRVVPDKKVVKKPTTVKKVSKATTFKKTTAPTVKPTPPKPKTSSIQRASKATASVRIPGKKTPSRVTTKVVSKPVVRTVQKVVKTTPKKITKVPLIPGIPGFVSGLPLVAGQVSPIPFQEDTPKSDGEEAFKIEGFKPAESKGGAQALDLSDKVLSEERAELPTEFIEETISGGPAVEEKRTFIDPNTGLLTTETKTTTPGDIIVTTKKGGESVSQTIGQSEVKPDFSDPLGSLFKGASQSVLNEVIGVKNIPAAVKGEEQEEFFATPSGLLFGGLVDSASSAIGDLGGAIFDAGRQAAGKKAVPVGSSVTSFGIAGDQVTIQQKERRGDALQILDIAGQRASRIAQADPLFAIGDAAVQIPLLVVAPVKAASLAIKGIGVAGKAVKGVSVAGRGAKQLSATGAKVTKLQAKTPLSKTFSKEFELFEGKKTQLGQVEDLSKLSTKQRKELQLSQRSQFEQGVEGLQSGRGIGRIGETTAEILPKPRAVRGFESTVFELGGTGVKVDSGFKATKAPLGKGAGKFVSGGDDFDFGGAGKGGPDIFGAGTGGVTKASKTVSKADIDKFSKEAKISKEEAGKLIKDQETRGGTGAVQLLLSKPKVVQAAKQNIFELEKAREALKKSKPSKAISSIANQKTQKRLSELIKQEKAKKPSTKADVATQKALKKLIAEEKAVLAPRTALRTSSKLDNLFAAPKKTKKVAVQTEEVFFRKPGQKAGILGGIATGVAIGSGVGLGLNIDQINKPQVLENPNIFSQEISRVVKDPTVQIEKQVFAQKELTKVPFRQTSRVDTPIFATTFLQTPKETTITKQQQSFFEEQKLLQPVTEITTTQFPPPGLVPGGGFPFEGSRKDELKESKSQRRFFRVFDIAKTPFGRIDVGLGAQRQSDKPIFEFLEEDEGKRKSKPKNLGEEFFSI